MRFAGSGLWLLVAKESITPTAHDVVVLSSFSKVFGVVNLSVCLHVVHVVGVLACILGHNFRDYGRALRCWNRGLCSFLIVGWKYFSYWLVGTGSNFLEESGVWVHLLFRKLYHHVVTVFKDIFKLPPILQVLIIARNRLIKDKQGYFFFLVYLILLQGLKDVVSIFVLKWLCCNRSKTIVCVRNIEEQSLPASTLPTSFFPGSPPTFFVGFLATAPC